MSSADTIRRVLDKGLITLSEAADSMYDHKHPAREWARIFTGEELENLMREIQTEWSQYQHSVAWDDEVFDAIWYQEEV